MILETAAPTFTKLSVTPAKYHLASTIFHTKKLQTDTDFRVPYLNIKKTVGLPWKNCHLLITYIPINPRKSKNSVSQSFLCNSKSNEIHEKKCVLPKKLLYFTVYYHLWTCFLVKWSEQT